MGAASVGLSASPKDVEKLLNPASIAVIGASQNADGLAGRPAVSLEAHGFPGAVYLVNPKYTEIRGRRCYESVQALPAVPDLALIGVRAARVPKVLDDCGQKGIRAAVIFSSGFAEVGADGAALQNSVCAVAARYGITVLGPNTNGFANVAGRVFAGFASIFKLEAFNSGSVSLVSQSGGLGFGIFGLLDEQGIGFRHVVSVGNECALDLVDVLEYFADDPGTEILLAYIEGLRNVPRLVRVAHKCACLGKPLLVLKGAVTEEGQKAAAAHTANLGGSSRLYEAAFKQAGILAVKDIAQLIDYCHALIGRKLASSDGIAIITSSAGAAISLADACVTLGLAVPPLSEECRRQLSTLLPDYGSVMNPVDASANLHNKPEALRAMLSLVCNEPQIAAVAVVNGSLDGARGVSMARVLADTAAKTAKPIVSCWFARKELASDAYEILREHAIPRFDTPARAANALAALRRFAVAQEASRARDRESPLTPAVTPMLISARSLLQGRDTIPERLCKQILRGYGLPVTAEGLATSIPEAIAQAEAIGYPVALKVESAAIAHKSDVGGVELGLDSREAVASGYERILRNVRAARPDAVIDGVLVQEMIGEGIEAIIGIKNDERFGPAIMFGLGGLFVEALEDVTFRMAPVSLNDALEMVTEIRGRRVLEGLRGKPHADVEALAEAIVAVSRLAIDLGDSIAELDINPIRVFERGKGVKVLDALITCKIVERKS